MGGLRFSRILPFVQGRGRVLQAGGREELAWQQGFLAACGYKKSRKIRKNIRKIHPSLAQPNTIPYQNLPIHNTNSLHALHHPCLARFAPHTSISKCILSHVVEYEEERRTTMLLKTEFLRILLGTSLVFFANTAGFHVSRMLQSGSAHW